MQHFSPSERAAFPRISILATLMPPPVDPAQAPTYQHLIKIPWKRWAQVLKSTVAKPVVVMMEDLEKKRDGG